MPQIEKGSNKVLIPVDFQVIHWKHVSSVLILQKT